MIQLSFVIATTCIVFFNRSYSQEINALKNAAADEAIKQLTKLAN